MKKLFIIFLSIVLFLPLYAQDDYMPKKKTGFARQHFEFGFDVGAMFANNLIGRDDIFTNEIVIDMNDIEENLSDNGAGLYSGFYGDFFLTIKNIRITGGKMNFGVSSQADGGFRGNLPKDLFTLMAQGNRNQDVFDGMVSFWGAAYADTGFGFSLEFGKLRVGARSALFTPLVFIPKSGINYRLDTSDGIILTTSGDISVYSPFMENGEVRHGFDISVYGSYSLFSFLDVGGSLTHIPIVPPNLSYRMRLTMDEKTLGASGQDLINGEGLGDQDTDIDFTEEYDYSSIRVFRPIRFDTYARLKPFSSEILVFTPNIGFTFDVSHSESYFNAGLELRLNFANVFMPYMATGRDEGLWIHRFGFAFNLRVFELDLETSFLSQDFKDSFRKKGFGFGLGIRFGW